MPNQSAITIGLLLALTAGGCGLIASSKPTETISKKDLLMQIEQLRQELTAKQKQNEKLNEQLTALRGFPADRLQRLVHPVEIAFGRFTRAYDQNDDGFDDGMIVYLLLRDIQGDKIKATGQVTIELWDLAEPQGGHLLQQWQYGLDELPQQWLSGFMTDHYKFELTWEKPPRSSNLTLKLRFKDALTGKLFEIQKMITASVLPAAG